MRTSVNLTTAAQAALAYLRATPDPETLAEWNMSAEVSAMLIRAARARGWTKPKTK